MIEKIEIMKEVGLHFTSSAIGGDCEYYHKNSSNSSQVDEITCNWWTITGLFNSTIQVLYQIKSRSVFVCEQREREAYDNNDNLTPLFKQYFL